MKKVRKLRVYDMFSGLGGFRIALEKLDCKVVGYCDNDKYAQKFYTQAYDTKNEVFNNDAREINTKELPNFDILCAGFPCQSFSIAGKRRGFKDTRGTMFFEVARVLKDKRPRYFILENVKGLLSHDGGQTFQTILKVLTDLGYSVQWQVLNSKDFGVPQNRERVYIVGAFGTKCPPKVFPIEDASSKNSCTNRLKPALNTARNNQSGRIYSIEGLSPCLTASHGNAGMFINKPRYDKYKESAVVETLTVGGDIPLMKVNNATKKGYDELRVGDSVNLSYPKSTKRRGRVGKQCSQTLDTKCNMGTLDG